jgi:hypothetical protein
MDLSVPIGGREKFHDGEPGYALVDLFEDGKFEYQPIPYGWRPEG